MRFYSKNLIVRRDSLMRGGAGGSAVGRNQQIPGTAAPT
jgi:hypothetical protein